MSAICTLPDMYFVYLLVLLDAFAGPRWRQLYATALAEGYRFLSFGDAMLVARDRQGGAS